jgi:long-chain acyl-CoA synthetase
LIFRIDEHPRADTALIEAATGSRWSYAHLVSAVRHLSLVLSNRSRTLVLLDGLSSKTAIAGYLACLECQFPVLLLHQASRYRQRYVDLYQPGLLILSEATPPPPDAHRLGGFPLEGLAVWSRERQVALHPRLALLLQTSGSTGSPVLVRLTLDNLESNAASIAQYLALSPAERALQSLPLAYSYGLSLLSSHLYAGGSLLLTQLSFLDPQLWRAVKEHRCTSFAGVPVAYQALARQRFDLADYGSLSTLTQAGGPLPVEVAAHFESACRGLRRRFFVMYGQTEATARISYVPPEALADKLGSIGRAIPGGTMQLEPLPGYGSQIIYRGPNVMLGYAQGPLCLSRGDDCKGRLATGDLARRDEDGYFYLTGRVQRFAKLYGMRIQLDEVESWLEGSFSVAAAAVELDGRLRVFVEPIDSGRIEPSEIKGALASHLRIPHRSVTVEMVTRLPRSPSGKKDRHALTDEAGNATR